MCSQLATLCSQRVLTNNNCRLLVLVNRSKSHYSHSTTTSSLVCLFVVIILVISNRIFQRRKRRTEMFQHCSGVWMCYSNTQQSYMQLMLVALLSNQFLICCTCLCFRCSVTHLPTSIIHLASGFISRHHSICYVTFV